MTEKRASKSESLKDAQNNVYKLLMDKYTLDELSAMLWKSTHPGYAHGKQLPKDDPNYIEVLEMVIEKKRASL